MRGDSNSSSHAAVTPLHYMNLYCGLCCGTFSGMKRNQCKYKVMSSLISISAAYLESLVADFFAFFIPDNLGLWIPRGLADKGSHSALDSCLIFWGSCESGGCCNESNN